MVITEQQLRSLIREELEVVAERICRRKGYYKKNGTYVHPTTKPCKPRKRRKKH